MNSSVDASKAPVSDLPYTGHMLIGGELVESLGGGWLDCINPATEATIGKVPKANTADVDRAVSAAEQAQPAWGALSIEQRGKALLKFCDVVMAHADRLARVEVADTGILMPGIQKDIVAAVELIKFYVGLGYEQKGQTIPATAENIHFTLREPYGVVGRILSFNHPINYSVRSIAAPLVAGNAVILKPSSQCPLSSAVLAEIVHDALPPGLINIISGTGGEAGEALVRHPRVKRLAFVGSVQTGMALQRSAAEGAVKHVTLELGGKNPFIVFPDVSIDKVSAAAVSGMNFNWQGQSCASTSRLFVHESIYDAVVEKVAARVAAIRVGDPFDSASQMGPIVSKVQYAKVLNYIDAGLAEGARLVAGGRRPPGAAFIRGYWVEPTVFADVTMDMRIAREEIFGPVLSILRWKEIDEVVAQANALEYGLTAAVWSNDVNTALRVARRVQSGYVWINGVGAHVRAVPYGGYKNSGIGRERGLEDLISYSEEKAIHIML
jgi:acyl-CoA reductase-like NAD-dependent aldehyde dehydrogenase